MFELDVKVERNVRAVNFIAFFVRTSMFFFYLDGKSSIFLPIL